MGAGRLADRGPDCSPRRSRSPTAGASNQLPIALELLDFEVQRNEGSDSPAGFKSTVRVTDREGRTGSGQCWMNNPFSYPRQTLAHLDRPDLQDVAGLLESRRTSGKARFRFCAIRVGS